MAVPTARVALRGSLRFRFWPSLSRRVNRTRCFAVWSLSVLIHQTGIITMTA